MALQIWLPLNNSFHNQGLVGWNPSASTTPSYVNGKLGKALSTGATTMPASVTSQVLNNTAFSYACWIYINGTPSGSNILFGYNGMSAQGGRQYSIFNYPTYNDFHWSWQNKIGSSYSTVASSSITGVFPSNTWTHLAVTYQNPNGKIYINGVLRTTFTGTYNTDSFAYDTPVIHNDANRYLCDVRIYNHCLSENEVKEISKGLVLHYTLSRGQDNLFIGTGMTATDRTGLVTNSSTDWTKYFRIYNGSTSIHSFSATNGVVEDTITLNSAANLGICFVRKATDISLDSTQYYTLSCEAKTTKSGASLAIGLSYYNTSNSWVWRGGTNTKAFDATNTWQKFTLTFKPDADTQYICYCFTVVGVANGTDTWTIRKCKLEKGSVATPWIPNQADALYSTIKLNDNTEYDISGYQNNGIKNDPNLIYSSDTVRFDASTMNLQGQDSDVYPLKGNIALNDIDTITISMWAKPSANGKQGSGFLCTSANSVPTDYQATVMNQYDNKIACTNTSGTVVNLTVSNQFTLNEWHHYAFVYDGTKAYFYKDGTLVTSATQTGKLKPITAIFPFYSKAGGLSRVSSGKMSDLRVYATALSADDILKLYHGIE